MSSGKHAFFIRHGFRPDVMQAENQRLQGQLNKTQEYIRNALDDSAQHEKAMAFLDALDDEAQATCACGEPLGGQPEQCVWCIADKYPPRGRP